jgi:hypothetical protein
MSARLLAVITAMAALLSGCTSAGPAAPRSGLLLPGTKTEHSVRSVPVYFSITIPAPKRRGVHRANYVSPNTKSLTVSVNGGAPQAISLIPSTDPHCNGATPPIVCTNLSVSAPIGSDTFALNIYVDPLVGGVEPPNPTLLSTYTTPTPIDIVEGTSNNLGTFATNGVPAAIGLSPTLFVAPADGRIHAFTLNAAVKDASGATIIAPGDYSTPILLAVANDPNHAVTLSPAQITAPSANGTTAVTVTYDASKPLTSAAISATAGSATSNAAYLNPLVYALSSPAALVVGGTTRTIAVSEAQYAGEFTVSGEGSSVRVVCSTIRCAPKTPGGTVTLTVTALAPGTPILRIADTNGAVAMVPLTVIAPPVFDYTGKPQTFTVPAGVAALIVRALGAQGGDGGQDAAGGRGGETLATIPVTPNERLELFVGGRGGKARDCSGGAAGFNGGGAGGGRGTHSGIGFLCRQTGGGGGGGASDVRRGGSTATDVLVLAGGGGGGSGLGDARGGDGGGAFAENGGGTHLCSGGGGATQRKGGVGGDCKPLVCRERGAAGKAHAGGDGGNASIPPIPGGGGGGGGGGYYGGGGACGTRIALSAAGGGGSSFVITSATNVTMRRGVRNGDGSIVLSW